ncbi:MAG: TonB-dependent receptor [Henriciella sp.]
MALVMGAHAQNPNESEGSLAAALNTFAAASDLEILFEPSVVMGLKVQPYDETASSLDVLNSMLAGTGLSASEAAPDVFIVAKAEIDEPAVEEPASQIEPSAGEATVEPASAPTPATGPIEGATEPGFIRGRVVDDGSDRALVGTILTLLETGQKATTNSRGEYRFGAVLPGTYTMAIDYIGTGATTEYVTVEAEETSVVNVRMPYVLRTVTVQSNRSSLSQALSQQRAADNSTTVVSADLLGSFPAENVSEALRRVPGVAFSRNDLTGEGEFITVRGFNAEAINIKLNGVQLNGTGVDRSIDLSGIQGENISQVTINKTLLPSQEANGTGGLVEIETKSGLDYGDRYLSLGVEGEFGEESDFGEESELSGTAAYKFTDTFGVAASLQYRDTGRMNINTNPTYTTIPVVPDGLTSTNLIPAEANFPFEAAVPNPLQTGGNYFVRDRDETNLTGSLNFAWDVASHTSLRLDLQRNEREQAYEERRATLRGSTASSDMAVPELNDEVRRRTYISGFAPTLGIADEVVDESTEVISFRGETNLGQWDFDYQLGFSETVRERSRDSVSFSNDNNLDEQAMFDANTIQIVLDDVGLVDERVVGGVAGLTADNIPVLNFSEAGLEYAFDPSEYYVSFATRGFNKNITEEWTTGFSSRYNFTSSFMDYLEGGFKYTENERTNSDDNLSNTTLTSVQSYSRSSFALSGRTYISDFGQTLDPFNLGVIGAGGVSIPFAASGSASDYLDQIDALTVDDPNTVENEQRFNLTDRADADPLDSSLNPSSLIVTEDRLALYAQASATFGKFDIFGGGRYEELDASGNSITSPSIREASGAFISREELASVGLVTYFDSSSTTDNFTPTIIANYRPSENKVFRLAWQRTTVNPDVSQTARPFQVVIDNRATGAATTANRATIREANPDLQASVTDNFDLDFSYFFSDNPGLIRLGLFYKKVENNFSNDIRADEETDLDIESRVLDVISPLLVDDPNRIVFDDDTLFLLQRPRNGEGGNIYGAEFEIIRQLDFLPETWPSFLENFNLLANVTWTDSDFPTDTTFFNGNTGRIEVVTEDLPLRGNTEWSGTASVAYEQGGFSGRLIYSSQSEAVTNYTVYNINSITPEFDTLDMRLQYTLDSAIGKTTFYLEGDNLLAGPETADVRSENGSFGRDVGTDFAYPTSVQFNGGRTFTLGARVIF